MHSTRLAQVISTKLNKMLSTTTTIKPSPVCRFLSTSSGDGNDTFKDTYNEVDDNDAMTQGVDTTQGETSDPTQTEDEDNVIPTKQDDHYIHPKTNLSSPKLQTPGVNVPLDPHVIQKRTKSTKSDIKVSESRFTCAGLDVSPSPGVNAPLDPHVIQKRAKSTKSDIKANETRFTCAGLDVSPWPDDESSSNTKDEDAKEGEDNNKEYFKHHKASSLSEIEIADTRKPLTRVMQGAADGYFGDEKVMGWKPEQLDSAEDSLRRATEMFREAAANGVPDWPHSRRLRQLLRERESR